MRPVDVPFDRSKVFDLVISSCGYEHRSSYLCRLGVLASHKMAVVYDTPAGPGTRRNRDLYQGGGWSIIKPEQLPALGSQILDDCVRPSICIDISSMPRRTMALVVQWLWNLPHENADVQFVYCPGQFLGSLEAAAKIEALSAGPVSDYFRGELRAPSVPLGLIVGLGLEPYRALGLVELVEPSRTWAFVSESIDQRFSEAASAIHETFLTSPNAPTLLRYDIRSLSQTYGALESLSFAVGLKYRLLMAPSGPKLFSLACLLVAAPRVHSRPAVWRVGSASETEPVDVVESGEVVAASAGFGRVARSAVERHSM